MTGIHQRRVEAHTTSFKLDCLDVEMIHSSSDTYIEIEKRMDHVKASPIKGSSWVIILKQAIENLRIPMKYVPKIMTDLSKEGILSEYKPDKGVQVFVSRIYQRLLTSSPS